MIASCPGGRSKTYGVDLVAFNLDFQSRAPSLRRRRKHKCVNLARDTECHPSFILYFIETETAAD